MDKIEPCPLCGAPGVSWRTNDTNLVGCRTKGCFMLALPVDAWNHLSRAARLLAAVERIDAKLLGDGSELLDEFWVERTYGIPQNEQKCRSLIDALIDLGEAK